MEETIGGFKLALTRLRQICCDPNLCFGNYTGKSDRLDTCLELCAGMVENGHQILQLSQIPPCWNGSGPCLDDASISNFPLQGPPPRARLVKEFNAGGATVFLIYLKAGGTGLLNMSKKDLLALLN